MNKLANLLSLSLSVSFLVWTDKISFITLKPAAAGGRLASDGRRAQTDGGRDEPGFQCRLYLLGRKTGDLQGPFEVSLNGGTYKLKRRMKIVLCFRKLPTFL